MPHRPIIVVLALVFLGLGADSARAQENLPQLIKRIQPAVVTVIGYNSTGRVIRLGSGFFINDRGHLITNGHVIYGVARAEVKTADGAHYPLKMMVAEDRAADLVKLVVEGLKGKRDYLPIALTLPEVGERVVVVGSPLGLEQTVSDGMVSGIRQITGRGEILQISAPVSPGSSGGPVVNLQGEVVGVATFQMGRGQNLNFAIPGKRVAALRDFPPRPLAATGEGETPKSQPGMKPALPPKPRVLVPPPRLQSPQPAANP
ncbi:MAG: S1C family serine protease [Deltaproteobacteria bacterium]|nr:S1C family serine protease [Deltaproteobacteria bacterium]